MWEFYLFEPRDCNGVIAFFVGVVSELVTHNDF